MSGAGWERVAALLRRQADACRDLGSPLYAALLARAADDVLAGGPVAGVLAGHEDDPPDSLPGLRLLGSTHRLVLEGGAPELARSYPSVGGEPDEDEQVWRAWRALVRDRAAEVRAGMAAAPQTNEVGRGAALVGGLLHVADRFGLPVRLVEVGASAGLNLRADHFRIEGDAVWGDPRSPVVLPGAWRGRLPPYAAVRVVERLGTDVAPVDPTTPEGERLLTSWVWPDQVERLARLRGAVAVARRVPARLERASALETVQALRPAPGVTTVLWHSVMWQYVEPAEQEAVRARLAKLGAAAGPDAPLAHLALEPTADGSFAVTLQTWPGGPERVLAVASPHGLPTTWR